MYERGVDTFGSKIFGADALILIQFLIRKKDVADPANRTGLPNGAGKHTGHSRGGAALQNPDNAQETEDQAEKRNAENGKKTPDRMFFLIHSAALSSLSSMTRRIRSA